MKTTAAILDALVAGEIDREQALARLDEAHREAGGRVENLEWARIDHDRARRRGFPEVIYGPGKTPEQTRELVERLAARNPNVLCTRTSEAAAALVVEALPEAEWDASSGLLWVWRDRTPRQPNIIAVISAGTADQKVAFEAQRCAEVMGNAVVALADVGVAGLHRLLGELDTLRAANVIICVAGFEAALPSVVAGLVDCPVIAVPTSTGYGAHFQGLAALLSCLSSCAAGVTTVNIDNGFGAAYAASLINRRSKDAACSPR
ncbi:nickel pincer cofactor biosynthesis protein LarB [Nannocystaceae bacterium ST9]